MILFGFYFFLKLFALKLLKSESACNRLQSEKNFPESLALSCNDSFSRCLWEDSNIACVCVCVCVCVGDLLSCIMNDVETRQEPLLALSPKRPYCLIT